MIKFPIRSAWFTLLAASSIGTLLLAVKPDAVEAQVRPTGPKGGSLQAVERQRQVTPAPPSQSKEDGAGSGSRYVPAPNSRNRNYNRDDDKRLKENKRENDEHRSQFGSPPLFIPAVLPPALPQVARFEVNIVGFEVHQQTADNEEDADGIGDEVFLRCATLLLDRRLNQLQIDTAPATKIFGDASLHVQHRIQAGSAGSTGGLQTGDAVPADKRVGVADWQAGTLPLQVFSGPLVPEIHEVVIIPTIWEWDDFGQQPLGAAVAPAEPAARAPWHGGGGAQNRAQAFHDQFAKHEKTLGKSIGAVLQRMTKRPAPLDGTALHLPSVAGHVGGHRPIGMREAGPRQKDEFAFTPRVLALDFEHAQQLSQTVGKYEVNGKAEKIPVAGIVPFRFVDSGKLGGDYTVFVQVLRK